MSNVGVTGFGPPRGRTGSYLRHSITRLAVLAGVPDTQNKAAVCALIKEYGYCLPAKQREVLERWCDG